MHAGDTSQRHRKIGLSLYNRHLLGLTVIVRVAAMDVGVARGAAVMVTNNASACAHMTVTATVYFYKQ